MLWLQAFVTLGGFPTLYWMIGVIARSELLWPQAFETSGGLPVVWAVACVTADVPVIGVVAVGQPLWPWASVTIDCM